MTNSTALSDAFDDHFSTIGPKLACIISLSNGPSFQEFKYLWPLTVRKGYSSIQVSGERSNIGNYHPISVISISGKIFQGAKKIIFIACHSGKLKLAFTSPYLISTSPQNFLTSRIDFTVNLFFC